MKKLPVGQSGLTSSALAYGCWRLAGPVEHAELSTEREAHGRAAVRAAYEAGFTFFDLADIYADGLSEIIFGKALKEAPGMRDQIVICTKCGIRRAGSPHPHSPYRYDSSAEYLISSCEGSLRRLGVDRIDLLLIHRPDYLGNPEEVGRAFSNLKQAGKVREFGFSNASPGVFRMYQKYCPLPLVANQIEVNLLKLDPFHDGTLEHCMTENVSPVGWSPLAGGRLSFGGPIDIHEPHHGKRLRIRDTLDHIGRELGASRTALALAWLMRHPSRIIPIVGATNPANIQECVKASGIDLSREDWYRLMEAAVGHRLA